MKKYIDFIIKHKNLELEELSSLLEKVFSSEEIKIFFKNDYEYFTPEFYKLCFNKDLEKIQINNKNWENEVSTLFTFLALDNYYNNNKEKQNYFFNKPSRKESPPIEAYNYRGVSPIVKPDLYVHGRLFENMGF